jgi:hypothetical protein
VGRVIGSIDRAGCEWLQYRYGPERWATDRPAAFTMWRYRELLPVPDGPVRYPVPIGGTPLLPVPALRAALGMPRLWIKDETRSPTASNKDRATALVLEDGLRQGATTITTASTGNAAVSTAFGAAAAGLRAVIFVSTDCQPDKLALMTQAGAWVFQVREGYAAAVDLSRAAARTFGWLDRNTGANPITIEAKKTVAFEVWEQLGRVLPDVMVAPVGDGPTLSPSTRASPNSSPVASRSGNRAWSACRPSAASHWSGPGSGRRPSRRNWTPRPRSPTASRCFARRSGTLSWTRCAAAVAPWWLPPTMPCCARSRRSRGGRGSVPNPPGRRPWRDSGPHSRAVQ